MAGCGAVWRWPALWRCRYLRSSGSALARPKMSGAFDRACHSHPVATTFQLMLGVGIICAVTGTITAWLVTFCQFPGRRVFAWALLLPLAMPTYLSAYSYADMLDQAGLSMLSGRHCFTPMLSAHSLDRRRDRCAEPCFISLCVFVGTRSFHPAINHAY